jgi:peroxiredoxin
MSRLHEEIKKYKESFKQKVPQDIQEIMLKATQTLEKEGLRKNVLKESEIFPNATFKDIQNNDISIQELFKQNDFLVINFYRGLWCPYCNLELQALQGILPQLKELNASIVGVSPQTPDNSLSTQEKNELQFDVVSDIDNIVAKELGLIFSLAEELRPIYEGFGIDIPSSNDDESYELPMPATFVINSKREVLYVFVDEDYTKRSEPQTILDIIKKNS